MCCVETRRSKALSVRQFRRKTMEARGYWAASCDQEPPPSEVSLRAEA